MSIKQTVKTKKKKPAWTPKEDNESFASSVMEGVEGGHDGMETSGRNQTEKPAIKRRNLTIQDYVDGVLRDDRMILARTITLVESSAKRHLETAQQVLRKILPSTGKAIRVGITGVPGAGKSTFINVLGSELCRKGHRVAVLAVDPSSSLSRGSILGDKTRMENLSQEPNCFIRPSPSSGTLGGVNRKTRETILVCEAAGFDVILVETVGVGQSEAMVSTMVDFFLLLTLTGAGDELQNIKKGVIEMADAVLINKADGDNKIPAQRTRQEFNQALHLLKPVKEGWQTQAYCCSALTGEGIEEIWHVILEFKERMQTSGDFFARRREQSLNWMHEMIVERIKRSFFENSDIKKELPELEKMVSEGRLPVTSAVEKIMSRFRDLREEENQL
ncbi:methylmalonyl Co-A mutase-associated GTPase MeaB [bacterium]|nr:methylmalonyl Co-A mutase-associated GTPase MeaB [bacterium]